MHLLSSLVDKWDDLTTEADMDVDRRAVGDLPKPETEVSREKLDAVVRAHLLESSRARLKAMWELVDRDRDGMLEEVRGSESTSDEPEVSIA